MKLGGTGRVRRAAAFAVGWLLATLLLSIAWYRVWLDKGFPGSTGILGQVLNADGERAYDAVAIEMFFVCAVALVVIGSAGVRLLRYSRGRLTGRLSGPA
jgi:hypothetical protein